VKKDDRPMQIPRVSFEFFPPRSIEASFRLWDAVQRLAPFNPRFVSVTYGAGGTTRDLTHEAVSALIQKTSLPIAAHLTCVDATRRETLARVDTLAEAGVRDLVVLRGDAPDGGRFKPTDNGFESSIELVACLRQRSDLTLRVGAYPDTHPDATSPAQCIEHLKRKFDAGADEALTQFFFEPDHFLRFRDACAAAGISQPITPGILPIEHWNGAVAFAKRCGMTVPTWLSEAFTTAQRDGRERLLATAVCTELCSTLMDEGVEHLHFYTLNKAELTRDVCLALGVPQRADLQNVA
jgi:methylenetetrahydrofolate reductase (NADPH)